MTLSLRVRIIMEVTTNGLESSKQFRRSARDGELVTEKLAPSGCHTQAVLTSESPLSGEHVPVEAGDGGPC